MKMTIGKKLGIQVTILLVLFVALGVFSYVQIRHIDRSLEEITEVEGPAYHAVHRMETNLVRTRLDLLEYLRNHKSEYLERISRAEEDFKELQKKYHKLVSNVDEGKPDDEVDKKYDRFKELVREIILLEDERNELSEIKGIDEEINDRLAEFTAVCKEIEGILGENIRALAHSDLEQAGSTGRKTVDTAIIATLILLLFGLEVGIFTSTIISRSITRPIMEFRRAAAEIGKGKLDTRIELFLSDEIGELAISFNKMARDLQKTVDSLNEEIIEHKAAVEMLTVANRELSDFAHIAAHDLKAPLRAIGTVADWVLNDYGDKLDQPGREQLSLLIARVERMNGHINSLLRYSEIGYLTEEEQQVHLRKLIAEIIDDMGMPENIEIIVEEELPVITCEKMHISKVFRNLIENAVKYMDKPRGWIKINCVIEDSWWKFSIADNGSGIESEYFEKIFKMFQTLAPRDDFEATGIGLAIAKKVVEMYGGTIWVKSQPGRGSVFSFTLPKHRLGIKNERIEANIVG